MSEEKNEKPRLWKTWTMLPFDPRDGRRDMNWQEYVDGSFDVRCAHCKENRRVPDRDAVYRYIALHCEDGWCKMKPYPCEGCGAESGGKYRQGRSPMESGFFCDGCAEKRRAP